MEKIIEKEKSKPAESRGKIVMQRIPKILVVEDETRDKGYFFNCS